MQCYGGSRLSPHQAYRLLLETNFHSESIVRSIHSHLDTLHSMSQHIRRLGIIIARDNKHRIPDVTTTQHPDDPKARQDEL
jgi:hypothetical protein